MNITEKIPFDSESFVQQLIQSAQIDENEKRVISIDRNYIQAKTQDYRNQISSYINTQNPNANVGEIIGYKEIRVDARKILPSGLPYKLIETAAEYSKLPDTLRFHIRLGLYSKTLGTISDAPVFTVERSASTLGLKKIALIFTPSTDQDAAIQKGAFENYEASFPAYLVHVNSQLKVEDAIVAAGSSAQMGSEYVFRVTIVAPWYTQKRDYDVLAGDTTVLGLNLTRITSGIYGARINANNLDDGNHPDYTDEMFYQVLLGYWGELGAQRDVISKTQGAISYQLPSHGIAGAPLAVNYWFGIPRSASYKSRVLDIKENRYAIADKGNNRKRQFNHTLEGV